MSAFLFFSFLSFKLKFHFNWNPSDDGCNGSILWINKTNSTELTKLQCLLNYCKLRLKHTPDSLQWIQQTKKIQKELYQSTVATVFNELPKSFSHSLDNTQWFTFCCSRCSGFFCVLPLCLFNERFRHQLIEFRYVLVRVRVFWSKNIDGGFCEHQFIWLNGDRCEMCADKCYFAYMCAYSFSSSMSSFVGGERWKMKDEKRKIRWFRLEWKKPISMCWLFSFSVPHINNCYYQFLIIQKIYRTKYARSLHIII